MALVSCSVAIVTGRLCKSLRSIWMIPPQPTSLFIFFVVVVVVVVIYFPQVNYIRSAIKCHIPILRLSTGQLEQTLEQQLEQKLEQKLFQPPM